MSDDGGSCGSTVAVEPPTSVATGASSANAGGRGENQT